MLIGLTGPKQAGKDTVYERARHIMADVLPVERASFADLLYESAAAALGVDVEFLRRWKADERAGIRLYDGHDNVHAELTFREYLQLYGTEAHRQVFGPDFWVDNVRLDHKGRIVFVTDVRFPNEAEAVRRAGGYVARVVGPDNVEHSGDGHASEAGLPPELIDHRLQNYVRGDRFRALDEEIARLFRRVPVAP